MTEDIANKTRNKKIAASYRVKEPINNFKTRVKIVQQRPLLADLLENEKDTRDSNFLEEEDRVFGWQEKVFSSFEISFYNDEKNCSTEYQKEYHNFIKENNPEGSQLYSYTEKDSKYTSDDLLTKQFKSKLSIRNRNALPVLQNRKPFSERFNKTVIQDIPDETRILSNHYVYSKPSTMYIMADLSRKDKILASSDDNSETILCTITYDDFHKILTVNPDFSNDQCYSVTNSSGVKFNYRIEHASRKQSSLELQQEQNDSRHELNERLMYKAAEKSHGLQLTSPNTQKYFLKLDIMSAHNFPFHGLFITYYIALPENWSTSEKEKLFGRTQRCYLENKSAYFSYATDISLDAQLINAPDTKKSLSWPRLLFLVASVDPWSRYRTEGYAALPLPVLPGFYKFNVPTWRGTGSIRNSLRRFFTGDIYELEDITYCSIPVDHQDTILNKSNLKVVQSGHIKITLNVVYQNSTSIKNNLQINYLDKYNTEELMNNVDNVFEQFKAARERMIQIRNLNL